MHLSGRAYELILKYLKTEKNGGFTGVFREYHQDTNLR